MFPSMFGTPLLSLFMYISNSSANKHKDGSVCLNSNCEKGENERLLVTDQVFMDISQGDEKLGRLVIGLFGDIVPKTVENFKELADGIHVKVDDNLVHLHYKNSTFHRVMRTFMVFGGDVLGKSGRTRISSYGDPFVDENYQVKHYGAGWIGMFRAHPSQGNACQFYVTSRRYRYMDGRFVVFGKILQGMNIVRQIENAAVDKHDKPIVDIHITDCGSEHLASPFFVNAIPATVDIDLNEKATDTSKNDNQHHQDKYVDKMDENEVIVSNGAHNGNLKFPELNNKKGHDENTDETTLTEKLSKTDKDENENTIVPQRPASKTDKTSSEIASRDNSKHIEL